MFSFGFFSTTIPYLILIAAWLYGFITTYDESQGYSFSTEVENQFELSAPLYLEFTHLQTQQNSPKSGLIAFYPSSDHTVIKFICSTKLTTNITLFPHNSPELWRVGSRAPPLCFSQYL